MEATYFNQSLSLWEPLLETVEKKNSRQEQWDFQLKVRRPWPSRVSENKRNGVREIWGMCRFGYYGVGLFM